jgi:transketolase
LFDQQTEEYKNQVLPPQVTKRVAIEMGITLGWQKYTGTTGAIIGIDHFGSSAPANILMEQFGFTRDNIVQKALALLRG